MNKSVRLFAFCLLYAAIPTTVFAQTQPSTQPASPMTAASSPATTQTTAEAAAATTASTTALAATTPAATEPSASAAPAPARHFPTPAELIAKLKAAREKEAAQPKVALFDLSEGISEKPADFSLLGGERTNTLQSLLDRLNRAGADSSVNAVLITLGEGPIDLAQAQEVRDTLAAIGKHKKVYIYADGYDTDSYTLASGATDICMLGGGEIMMPGVGFSTMFYKGAFDKIGVEADYVQIGKYKGAKEPYTNTQPSEELKGELDRLAGSLFDQIVSGIAEHRTLSVDAVRQLINDTMISGESAQERGLVDHLVDQDGLRPLIEDQLGGQEMNLVRDYGEPPQPQVDLSSPFGFFSLLTRRPEVSDKPAVALIYAEGVISDGEGNNGVFSSGGGVASEPMRRAFRLAAHDDNIKAVVIRIDSPGGSALASEVMWQAVRRVSVKKPVIISVGSMAASGGYYLASAGDTIFADPVGIVGSIGVVGGKFVLKDLYGKLGLTTDSFSRGDNAGLFSSDQPFTAKQRDLIEKWMTNTYVQFTQRVMTTRSGKIKNIDQVAQGRIFLAPQAKDLGLVDEIGGTDAAIACAADRSGLSPGSYQIRVLPAPKTLADLFTRGGDADAQSPVHSQANLAVNISDSPLLQMLDNPTRQMLISQLEMIQLLQRRPIALMSPYVLNVR
jgi:protease-4